MKDLSSFRVETFYSQLLATGIGVRTVRKIHSILHRALEKARMHGLLIQNPTSYATLPRYQHAEMKVLDNVQANQLLVAARGSQYEALYHTAITTGMREGELFGLKWSDLSFHTGQLRVQRQVQHVRGQGKIFQEPKTRSGRRTILLGEGTLQVLRLHHEKQRVQKEFMGQQWQENDLIFPSKVGSPMDAGNMMKDFNKVLEKAGLQKIRFHDLRHTCASLMLNNGVPAIVVSRILGHSKPSITLDIYGHLYNEHQEDASRLMDELVSPIIASIPAKNTQEVLKA